MKVKAVTSKASDDIMSHNDSQLSIKVNDIISKASDGTMSHE